MTESTNLKRTTYGLMDIIKLIMAVLVVTIHRRLGSDDICLINLEVNTIARLAVPFFFACSSFLFFSKSYDYDNKRIWAFVKKNLRLYLIWFLLYLPQTVFKYVYSFNYSIKKIIFLLICDNMQFPVHLWFLPGLALSMMLVYFVTKKSEKVAGIVSVLLVVLSVAYTLFNVSFENSYLNFLRGTLFIGFPNVYIGFWLSRHKISFSKAKCLISLALSVAASLVWGYIEFKFKTKTSFIDNKPTYLLVVFFLMLLCINYGPQKGFIKLRKASMLIYYLHLFVYQEILYIALDYAGLGFLIQSKLAIFLITIAYTALFTFLIITLEKKEKFKWLKKLYN